MTRVDWSIWLKCPICRVSAGHPCVAAHALVVDGRPAGGATVLSGPHSRRRMRSGSQV